MSKERRLSREEEERLIALSIIPLMPVFFLFVIYLAQQKSAGAIASSSEAFSYIFLAGTLWLVAGWGIYEVASSFKVKLPLLFRIKRFLSRTLFVSACMFCFYVYWVLFSLLLSSVLRVECILLLALISVALTISVLAKNPKTLRLIKKLTMEE